MKSKKDIVAAEKEAFDKRWYDRSLVFAAKTDPRDDLGAKGRRRIEKQYGEENLGPYEDFEWGFLAGKHAALRWVLDNDATWDDDWLGDT